jgi:hypothetical protein
VRDWSERWELARPSSRAEESSWEACREEREVERRAACRSREEVCLERSSRRSEWSDLRVSRRLKVDSLF